MSDEPKAFSSVNSGYTSNLDYDNNGVPDWQQDLHPLHPDGYARDIDRNIIHDPEPMFMNREYADTTFADRAFRDDVANMTATYEPTVDLVRNDPDRDSVSDANLRMREGEHKGDAAPKREIDPDALLAHTIAKGAHTERTVKDKHRRRDALYGSMKSHHKDPSDSGFDIFAHAVSSFARGWKAQRARMLAEETHRINQADAVIQHAIRYEKGLNAFGYEALEKLYPGLADKLIARDILTAAETPAQDTTKAPAEGAALDAPSPTGEPTQWQPKGTAEKEHAAGAETDPGKNPATQLADGTATDKAAGLDGQTADKTKTTEKAKTSETDKVPPVAGQEKEPTAGSNTAAGKNGKADDLKVDQVERPFREPWPYNPRIIEKASQDPAGISSDELVDAYASARGEQEMLRRMETRVRSIGSGIPEDKLAGMKLSDQKKASGGLGFGTTSEARQRLDLRTQQLKGLGAEMKTRGLQTKNIDRECALRAKDLPLAHPDINMKPVFDQAVKLRKAMGLPRFDAENPVNIDAKTVARPFVPPRGPRVPMPGVVGAGKIVAGAVKAAQTIDQNIQAQQGRSQGEGR